MAKAFSPIWLLLLLFILSGCQERSADLTADLILTNARIWTGNPEQIRAEAIAIKADTILAVGNKDDMLDFQGRKTEVRNVEGKMIVPGFIDCHVHFVSSGRGLSSVQLRDADRPEEFVRRIRDYAATVPEGAWILEGNWDHKLWDGRLPHRAWIDRYTPNHPVFVSRLDGHMALANTAALRAAGCERRIPEMEGGTVVRDKNGKPTGVLKDKAMSLVAEHIPAPTPEQEDAALMAAVKHLASKGVTTVHNMDAADINVLEAYERARRRGDQLIRFYVAVGLHDWEALRDKLAREGRGDEWLRIGLVKGMVDGSLGAHTAAFFAPFTDAPEDRGLLVTPEPTLRRQIIDADAAGLQVAVHAIGDRANDLLLDIFAEAIEENGTRDRRFRIEHAQHPRLRDIRRFGPMGVIASVQPYHAIDDGRWAEKVIGEKRLQTTYAFRSFLDHDARLAFGSDWSVAPPDPLLGIYAAVTRRTIDGENPNGWTPEQKIKVEEALRAYTIDAAYASFEEHLKGSLEPGKLADLVMLDRDILTAAPESIPDTRVLMTMVGGEVVYER